MVVGMNLVIVLLQFGHQLSIRAMGKALMGHEALAYEAICDLAKIMARLQITALVEKPHEGPNKTKGDNPQ
jgi:hypothetical protein